MRVGRLWQPFVMGHGCWCQLVFSKGERSPVFALLRMMSSMLGKYRKHYIMHGQTAFPWSDN